jgi:hypothetical protein
MLKKVLPNLAVALSFLSPLLLGAALFLSGPGPAIAQAPPPVPALPDTERRTSYSLAGTTCACAVNFAIYGDSTDVDEWIEVYVAGVRYASTDPSHGWALTSVTGPLATIPRPITDAVLTFTAVQTGTVQIVGAQRPRRTAQFAENRGVAARDLNQVITGLTAMERETWDRTSDIVGRTLRGLPGEQIAAMPSAAARAGTLFCWDATGLIPVACAVPSGAGNVVGPASSVNGHVAIFSGASGTVLADGGTIGGVTLTGDVTGTGSGTFATTLATVNSNVGTFGDAQNHVSVTVNAKGLITGISAVTPSLTGFGNIQGVQALNQMPNCAPSALLSMISSVQGTILYRDAGAWLALSPGTSGQLLSTGGAGANPAWITASGTGTVTSAASDGSIKTDQASNGPITTTGTLSLWGEPNSLTDCSLAAGVSGGAFSVALKTKAGNDPSATEPCIISFRNATAATGDYTYVKATAQTVFSTATSGSTFGSVNSVPFRLWIVAFNNAGTVVVGVIKASTTTQIFPINEGAVQSSTACNACGTATSSGVYYTTATQTSKAIRILGYMDWSAGLGTVGAWASGPTTIQNMTAGVKTPGATVQTVSFNTGSTSTTSSASYVVSNITVSIAPIATPNLVRVFTTLAAHTGAAQMSLQLQRSSTALAQASAIGANATAPGALIAFDAPGTVSSTPYAVYFRSAAGGTNVVIDNGTIIVDEIQG